MFGELLKRKAAAPNPFDALYQQATKKFHTAGLAWRESIAGSRSKKSM
jgi:hypothetical protein